MQAETLPIPSNLREHLPNVDTPWAISPGLFERMKSASSHLCEVKASDPEARLVLRYFCHDAPLGYGIRRIYCIHNPAQTQAFEATLRTINAQTQNPHYSPNWPNETSVHLRGKVIDRWRKLTRQFSPIHVGSGASARQLNGVKILPMWHGSNGAVCQSVCKSGFSYMGKHHYRDAEAAPGASGSTDQGFFASGIYFTDSARYAAGYASGHLLMNWVSMREPYPVVAGKDMDILEGKEAYQNYNAHIIPVVSAQPENPNCMIYLPCNAQQKPAWDELVVFESAQTLPRFWVEIGRNLPISPFDRRPGLLTRVLNGIGSLPWTMLHNLRLHVWLRLDATVLATDYAGVVKRLKVGDIGEEVATLAKLFPSLIELDGYRHATEPLLHQAAQSAVLERLSLGSSEISLKGLNHLVGSVSLRNLDLSCTDIGLDAVQKIAQVASLKCLSLWCCKHVDYSCLKELSKLENLEELDIHGCPVEEKKTGYFRWVSRWSAVLPQFGQLRAFRIEILCSNPSVMDDIARMPRLQDLCLTSNHLTQDKLTRLAKAPKLQRTALQGVAGEAPAPVSGLQLVDFDAIVIMTKRAYQTNFNHKQLDGRIGAWVCS